jgi:prefoldin alpha subunit
MSAPSQSPEIDYQTLVDAYYNLRMQLESLMTALNQVQSMLAGISISNSVIEELRGKEADHEIILPIGNFAYIKAKIPEPDSILVSVGRSTLVERDDKQALDFIRKKRDELQKQEDTLKKNVEQASNQLKQIETVLEQYQQQAQQASQSPSSPK